MADLSQIPTDQLVQMLNGQGSTQAAPVPSPQAISAPHADQTWRQELMGGPVGQFIGGAMQPIYGADQLAYKGLGAATSLGGNYPNPVSDFFQGRAKAVGDEAQQASQSNDLARTLAGGSGLNIPKIAGTIASPVNAAAGALEIPSALGTALLRGGAYSAMNPTNDDGSYWQNKAIDTGIGAGTGGALQKGGALASALVDPSTAYGPKVSALLKANVPLTAGQIVGGPVRTLEDAMTSVPIVGDMVKARQRDAMAGLNTAVINRSLAPIGEKLPEGMTGHEAIGYAQGKLGDAYDNLLPKLSASADPQLTSDMSGIVQNAAQRYGLNNAGQQHLFDMLHGQIVQKSNGGQFSGDVLKDIQSNLGYQARNFAKSPNPDQKNMADALFDARDAFNDFIARQNPNEAPQLQAINSGYANYARAEKAAAASKTGIFTPTELNRAVKSGGTQAQNATGSSLMQDLSSAGIGVLPPTVPDSGTALRHLTQLGIGALAGEGAERVLPGLGAGAAVAGTGLSLGGTKLAQALLRSALTKRPYTDQTAASLGQAITSNTPAIARLGIPALTAAMNPTPQ